MEQWQITEPRTFDLTGVRRLDVRLVGGRVDVVGRDDDAPDDAPAAPAEAAEPTGTPAYGTPHAARPAGSGAGATQVEISSLDGPLVVTLENGTLSIVHEKLTWGGVLDWLGGKRSRAVVSVSVPMDTPVRLALVTADAVVSGIVADSTAVKSVSGNVTLDGVRSRIDAQTVSGDLEVRRVSGDLTFKTVSGDLTVAQSRATRVNSTSVSGDAVLDLALDDGARLDFSTVSGDVTLRLDSEPTLDVDVRTTSGSLQSEFPYVNATKITGSASMSGRIGGGGTPGALRAKSVSGDVTLLVRVPA